MNSQLFEEYIKDKTVYFTTHGGKCSDNELTRVLTDKMGAIIALVSTSGEIFPWLTIKSLQSYTAR